MVDTSDKLLGERGVLMMTTTRREFTEEFKREAVGLLESSGRPLMQVAKELGIQPSMLRNWRGRLGTAGGRASVGERPVTTGPAMSAEGAEIRRLRKELERAQMERDIPKKAIGIFSGPPR
jgi:transposase